MKTKSEILEEINKLSMQITELAKTYGESPEEIHEIPCPQWPRVGSKYFFIDEEGAFGIEQWTNDSCDQRRKEFGNVFLTLKEAKKEAAYLTFERAVRAKAKELNGDWVTDRINKNFSQIELNGAATKSAVYSRDKNDCYLPIIRGSECETREKAQVLLSHFGAEKFLAYATGGEL